VNDDDNEAVCVDVDECDALPELELLTLNVPEVLCDELKEGLALGVCLECDSDSFTVIVR
jgi:hypothetical protein